MRSNSSRLRLVATICLVSLVGSSCTVGTAPRIVDSSRPGEVETETTSRVVAVFQPPSAGTDEQHALQVQIKREYTAVDYEVKRQSSISPQYKWGVGNSTIYVLADVLVVPRLVGGFVVGLVWGSGLAKPSGAAGEGRSRSGGGGVPKSALYTINPLVDFFARIAGGGMRRKVGERTRKEYAAAPNVSNNYVLNFVDWFGWFLPAYPVIAGSVSEAGVKEDPLDPTRGQEVAGSTRVESSKDEFLTLAQIAQQYRFVVDGRPVGELSTSELAAGSNQTVRLDMTDYLQTEKWVRWNDDNAVSPTGYSRHDLDIQIIDSSGTSVPIRKGAAEVANAKVDVGELNVDWRVPRGSTPPDGVVASLALAESYSPDRWEPGEEIVAELTLRNDDQVEAWSLTPKFVLPEFALENEVELVSVEPASLERLNPGESFTFRARLRSRPDWVWPEQKLVVTASAGTYRAAPAEIEVLTSSAPELRVVAQAIDEIGDNADGKLIAGESFNYLVTVINAGTGIARDMIARIDGKEIGALATTNDPTLPSLPVGSAFTFLYTVKLPADFKEISLDRAQQIPGLSIELAERNPLYSGSDDARIAGKSLFNVPIDVILAEAP